MRRYLPVFVSVLALALLAPLALANDTITKDTTGNLGVYPTIAYVPPITLIGAEFELGPFTIPVLYGHDALWLSFESAATGKFWSVGCWIYDLSGGSPTFDMSIGLGYNWGGFLKAEGFFTSSGWYGLAIGFTLTVW